MAGYSYYKFRGCDGRNEIFDGIVADVNACKARCEESDECVSFEYWGNLNPHHNYGAGYCHGSSSCTYELSYYSEYDGTGPNCNLYIKGK